MFNTNYGALTHQAERELDWFIEKGFTEIVEAGHATIGALINRLSSVYHNYMRHTWAPFTILRLEEERILYHQRNKALGTPRADAFADLFTSNEDEVNDENNVSIESLITLEQLITMAVELTTNMIRNYRQVLIELICTVSLKNFQMSIKAASITKQYCSPTEVVDIQRNLKSNLDKLCVQSLDTMQNLITTEILKVLNSDNSEFRLNRFTTFLNAVIEMINISLQHWRKDTETTMLNYVSMAFQNLPINPHLSIKYNFDKGSEPVVSFTFDSSSLSDVLPHVIVLRLSALITDILGGAVESAAKSLSEIDWIEQCAEERRHILKTIRLMEVAEEQLMDVLQITPLDIETFKKQENPVDQKTFSSTVPLQSYGVNVPSTNKSIYDARDDEVPNNDADSKQESSNASTINAEGPVPSTAQVKYSAPVESNPISNKPNAPAVGDQTKISGVSDSFTNIMHQQHPLHQLKALVPASPPHVIPISKPPPANVTSAPSREQQEKAQKVQSDDATQLFAQPDGTPNTSNSYMPVQFHRGGNYSNFSYVNASQSQAQSQWPSHSGANRLRGPPAGMNKPLPLPIPPASSNPLSGTNPIPLKNNIPVTTADSKPIISTDAPMIRMMMERGISMTGKPLPPLGGMNAPTNKSIPPPPYNPGPRAPINPPVNNSGSSSQPVSLASSLISPVFTPGFGLGKGMEKYRAEVLAPEAVGLDEIMQESAATASMASVTSETSAQDMDQFRGGVSLGSELANAAVNQNVIPTNPTKGIGAFAALGGGGGGGNRSQYSAMDPVSGNRIYHQVSGQQVVGGGNNRSGLSQSAHGMPSKPVVPNWAGGGASSMQNTYNMNKSFGMSVSAHGISGLNTYNRPPFNQAAPQRQYGGTEDAKSTSSSSSGGVSPISLSFRPDSASMNASINMQRDAINNLQEENGGTMASYEDHSAMMSTTSETDPYNSRQSE